MEQIVDFIHIGPGRAGTTWIYNALEDHPEVCMARNTKETQFFGKYYGKGVVWYKNFFEYCDSEKVKGEVSNLYIYDEDIPSRIHNLVPEVKLVTCLRSPVERIRSVYQFRKRNGVITGSFDEAINEHPDMIADNYYWQQISNYLKYFDDCQLLVLFFDDLKERPEGFLKQLYGFLEVKDTFKPEFINEKINQSTEVRLPAIGSLAKSMAKKLREWEMFKTLNFLKWNPILRKIILKEHGKGEKKEVISNETKEKLVSLFKDDIKSLMEYTNRDLSHWLEVNSHA